ncbi:hypothetical protein DICPUDRAFT_153350 [Dictyostelium purpureum]|uniref:Uncharacterized protein n=1 Tax=Dictyostelium purpureum TaxID=5786 RepID=F0ZNN9_DICPU|nr:uncharacterized protein DICPUDRAFT_153350 [Dictyostelium purpureum]EGC34454.1 hypothetical protein DICPUDRAFT_153350 [Dictyostelium purpureum]|eukprot:XP_003289039.1 hypothetical protein DICPUDRAFT_153350 [Dictyostelium purpureum]
MEEWLKILGIIEFIVALVVLLFLIGVIAIITKNRHIEFNQYWKSRTLIASSAFIWVIFLLLGNEYLWSSKEGIFGVKESHSRAICALHVFFTVGLAEPLFFLIFLFTIKSKTNQDKENSNTQNNLRSNGSHRMEMIKNKWFRFQEPNTYVYVWSLVCTLPLVIIHLILLILDATDVTEPRGNQYLFTVYDSKEQKCSVPIISTGAFAVFFVIFLFFFVIVSRNFSKSIINRSLINRIRILQFSFVAFLPLEVAIRVVLIFTTNIGDATPALFNAFFFVDIIVLLIGVLEFALFPILDSLGFYSSSIRMWKFKNIMGKNNGQTRNKATDENDDHILLTSIQTNTNTPTSISEDKATNGAILTPTGNNEKIAVPNDNNKNELINNNNNNNDSNNNNKSNAFSNIEIDNNNSHQSTNIHQQSELEKLKIKHKSPIFDRVRDTEDVNIPPQPLSTPLSSVSSKSSHLEQVINSNSVEKKKRRFSLSSKKRSSSSSSSSSPIVVTPISQSPPQQSTSQNVRYLHQTPVDNFKDQLFKYSNQQNYK